MPLSLNFLLLFGGYGESLNYQLRQFVRDIMDGSISTTQSWKRLWSQVPGAIIVTLSKATASDAETRSDLGQVRQNLLLTQCIQVVSSLCVMVNPNCTHRTYEQFETYINDFR